MYCSEDVVFFFNFLQLKEQHESKLLAELTAIFASFFGIHCKFACFPNRVMPDVTLFKAIGKITTS